MELAFFVGAFLGALFAGILVKSHVMTNMTNRAIADNHKWQLLLNDQYHTGIDRGRLEATNEFMKEQELRDSLLVTAGIRAGYMDINEEIDLPSGEDGETRTSSYIVTIVNNYVKAKYDIPFDEYVEVLLTKTFGVRK